MVQESTTSTLLRRHAELEAIYGDGDNGNFLSGWQCENPWREILDDRVAQARTALDGSKYQYLENDTSVADKLSEFHHQVDGIRPKEVFCGEGSSSLIFTFCAWLKSKHTKEIFYLPPLYFALHYALKLFGISARPIAGKHSFEDGFVFNLPSCSSVLVFCDPVWYAGMPLAQSVVSQLIDWQNRTGSLIFVDGSFQYARWDGTVQEPTAQLDNEHTLRLICPTKTLAFHGYRFAYATMPTAIRVEFRDIYSSIYGSSSVQNIAFARVAVDAIRERTITNSLMRLASDCHRLLRDKQKITATWKAECGYFVFEQIMPKLSTEITLMDGLFFEQRGYKDHRRINLLSPSIKLLA